MRGFVVRVLLTAAIVSGAWCSSASATLVVFTVDSDSSELALTGILDLGLLGSAPLGEQSAGSLLTAYTGSITVDLDSVGSSIQFDNATALDAMVSGSYLPGPDDGDYGFKATINEETRDLAMRDAVFTMAGAGLLMTGDPDSPAGATFDLSAATALATAGSVDAEFTLGPTDLNGLSASSVSGTGQVKTEGLMQTLTLNVTFDYDIDLNCVAPADLDTTFAGTIVATREVPEPASFALLVLGSLAVLRRRR